MNYYRCYTELLKLKEKKKTINKNYLKRNDTCYLCSLCRAKYYRTLSGPERIYQQQDGDYYKGPNIFVHFALALSVSKIVRDQNYVCVLVKPQ